MGHPQCTRWKLGAQPVVVRRVLEQLLERIRVLCRPSLMLLHRRHRAHLDGPELLTLASANRAHTKGRCVASNFERSSSDVALPTPRSRPPPRKLCRARFSRSCSIPRQGFARARSRGEQTGPGTNRFFAARSFGPIAMREAETAAPFWRPIWTCSRRESSRVEEAEWRGGG